MCRKKTKFRPPSPQNFRFPPLSENLAAEKDTSSINVTPLPQIRFTPQSQIKTLTLIPPQILQQESDLKRARVRFGGKGEEMGDSLALKRCLNPVVLQLQKMELELRCPTWYLESCPFFLKFLILSQFNLKDWNFSALLVLILFYRCLMGVDLWSRGGMAVWTDDLRLYLMKRHNL